MKNILEFLNEAMPFLASSAGISGSVIAGVCCYLLRKAKKDAERKQEERLKLEILRLEGEETLSALIIALARHAQGKCDESELNEAEKRYAEYLVNNRQLKNNIISKYTQ